MAEAAIEHFRNFPNRSLGIGTFNIKQQQAILEEIELQLRYHPEMEEYFSAGREDHFFVKNLETIQGDERDVIFISVGFGFDETGRLTLNFGPLNNEGGWRRLNVLITRAREKCVVFSNFKANDLPLDERTPQGLRALKVFLQYAENRDMLISEVTGKDTDSPFEDAVYRTLKDHGYEVRKQVGCAGFRVDLAVVDSDAPGKYLIGIECDGAKYHSSPVARDRDRLRQQILENLGWCIHRVWSTDWYRNRKETEERLIGAIEKVKREPKKTLPRKHIKKAEANIDEKHELELVEISELLSGCLADSVPEYEVCKRLGISTVNGIHEKSTQKLAEAVSSVVEVEGPVHVDEVIRRIRTLWGLKRTGSRIQDALMDAISVAASYGYVIKKGDFLWSKTTKEIPVRRRTGDPPAKIELICDEEIAESVKLVIKSQHATKLEYLIIQSSRMLGIQATSDNTANRISKVVNSLIRKKQLTKMPNGMIGFA